MSLVAAIINDKHAVIASDGHAVRYDDDGIPRVTRTDCSKIFRTKSGQLIGRVGQTDICRELEYRFRDFDGSLAELADAIEKFTRQVEPMPQAVSTIGVLSVLIIGRDASGRVFAIDVQRDADGIKRDSYSADPGQVGSLYIGFTKKSADLLDELCELTPNVQPENYANFARYAIQRVNQAFPVEVGGDFFSEELDGPSQQVMDGQNHVRLAASHAAANVAYNFQGTWNSVTAYVIGDEVVLNGTYWIAKANNTNSQPSLSNGNWQTVGLNTLASADQTAKTASIASTLLFTAPVSGFYFVAITLLDRQTTANTSTLNALLSYTEGGIAGLQQQTATITSNTLSAIAGSSSFVIFADESTAVNYSTTLGGAGAPTGGYDIHIRVLGPF